jgi:hypothetical protein
MGVHPIDSLPVDEQAGRGRLVGGGAGEAHAHGVAQAAAGGQKPARLLQVVGEDVRPRLSLGPECTKVSERCSERSADSRLGDGVSCLLDIARTSRHWCS